MKNCDHHRSGCDIVRHSLLRWVLPAAALLFGAQQAWARCDINSGPYDKETGLGGYTTKTINMLVGDVVVPNDARVGQALLPAPKEFPIYVAGGPGSNTPWKCSSDGGTVTSKVRQGNLVSGLGLEKVYTTNVDGIGIQLLRKAVGDASTNRYYPHEPIFGRFEEFAPNAAFAVQLYKIADKTGSGPLDSGTYSTYEGDDGYSVLTSVISGNAITIITPTCSVDAGSRNIPVSFGKVPLSGFKGRGTTTAERNFNIKLQCGAGTGEKKLQVLLRMDAIADPAGDAGVIRLTQGGATTASGVGIQIVDEKKVPVTYGAAAPVGPSKDGPYVLSYTARYFQTGNKVTPGRADGTATFTIQYK
ncbi:fimbrial protein [Variovorax sp. LT1R20]|uniref:fimbrial protein n=1 Tax=Variovorax sp. LT1R20 TaxID=3443729 RepID=UPI003F48D650